MPVRPGGTCPVCGATIDKRAKTCLAHRPSNLTPEHQRAAVEARWEKERRMDTLVSAVLRLDDTLRNHLSAVIIDEDTDGALTARLSIALMIPHGTDATAGPYTIKVDTTDLPGGVSVSSWTRWPDITCELGTDVSALDQIQQLQDSQLVGDLDVATFEPVDGATLDHPARRWIIKPTVLPRTS